MFTVVVSVFICGIQWGGEFHIWPGAPPVAAYSRQWIQPLLDVGKKDRMLKTSSIHKGRQSSPVAVPSTGQIG